MSPRRDRGSREDVGFTYFVEGIESALAQAEEAADGQGVQPPETPQLLRISPPDS